MDIVLAKLLPRGIVFLDEAIDSTRLANFFIEQEEPPPVLQRLTQSVPWTARPSSDEELASPPYQFFFREQEEPQPGWPRVQTIQWLARPYSDEELASPPYKNFFQEQEDAWIGRLQSLPWLAYSALPLDEDEPTATIAAAVDDEQPALFLVQSPPWLARPFTDDELAAPPYEYFYLEQEEPWVKQVQTVTWLPRPAFDDETRPIPGVVTKKLLSPPLNRAAIATSLQATLTASPVLGNSLIVIVWGITIDSGSTLSSTVTDSAGNVYTQDGFAAFSGGVTATDAWCAIYRCFFIPSVPSWVKFTYGGGNTGVIEFAVVEVTGLTGALDGSNSHVGLSSSITPGAITTTNQPDYLALAVSTDNAGTYPSIPVTTSGNIYAPEQIDDNSLTSFQAGAAFDVITPAVQVSNNPLSTVPSDRFAAVQVAYKGGTLPPIEQEDSLIPRVTSIVWLARPALDDEISTSLANFFTDQEEPAFVRTTAIAWAARPFLDDDLYPTATTIGVDEEQPFVAAVSAIPWLACPYSDEELAAPPYEYFFLEQEEPSFVRTTAIVWVARPFLDDDLYPTVTAINVDEEQLPLLATQAIAWLSRPFTDEELAAPPYEYFFLEQEEARAIQVQTVAWTARPASDDDVLGATVFGLDQEEPWTPQYETVAWSARPFLDDEISTRLGNFFLEQEEYWVAQIETVPWVPRPYLYDEISTSLANFGREQEEPAWPIPAVLVRPWAARPFTDDEINFFVAGRLIIVELTVVDNADGTGALATISGSDIASNNTILVQPYSSTDSWAPGAVRTGDGTATLGTLGYQWAVVVGTSGNDLVLSNMVPFAATTNADAVQQRMSNALVARIQQLVMAMGINARVYNQIIEDDRVAQFPCIFVVFAGETEDDAGGLNDLDDVGYPFRVMIVDRNSENYQVPKGKYLLWRQQIARALRNQRLDGVSESILTKVRYSNIADKRLPSYQYFVSSLKVSCISREVRGLT